MALIRLAYAADLPPTDKLVRDLLDNPPQGGSAPRGGAGSGQGPVATAYPSPKSASQISTLPQGEGRLAAAPRLNASAAPALRTLDDIVALAAANGASILRVNLENDVHLVRLEPGHIEFRPSPRAPQTLAGDLKQKLKDWTGMPWSVSIAREGGEPTIAERRRNAKAARIESVMQEPLVRAVLDRFPGAEIVAVREAAVAEQAAEAMPEKDE